MKRFTALLLAVIMLLGLASCKNGPEGEQTGAVSPDEVFMSTENFSVSLGEATYLYYEIFNSYYSNNAEHVGFLALDAEQSLKIQDYSEGYTWYEFFLDETKAQLEWMLLYCEAANAAGYTITDEIKNEAKDVVTSINQFAVDYAYDPIEYIHTQYGDIVTEDYIRSYLEKYFLANKFYDDLVKGYTFTEAEEDAYLAANPDKFKYVDIVTYTMRESLDREASANAMELRDTATEEEFYSYITSYEEDVINKEVGVDLYDYYAKMDNQISDWAFSAEVGEKYVYSDTLNGAYTVCMLVTPPTLQEYNVRDMRIIVLDKDRYNTFELALQRKDEVIKKWEEGDATAESFSALAKIYSADENAEYGSSYSDVDKSFDLFTEESITWLFEEAKPGEINSFEYDNGYFIIYCEAEGRTQWRVLASDYLAEEKYYEDLEGFKAAHPVTFNENMAWHIDH